MCQFYLFEGGQFPIILGLDFLSHSKMVMDLEAREYYFRFAPHEPMNFESLVGNGNKESFRANSYFGQLAKDASKILSLSSAFAEPNPLGE